jgi:hypothetical protein
MALSSLVDRQRIGGLRLAAEFAETDHIARRDRGDIGLLIHIDRDAGPVRPALDRRDRLDPDSSVSRQARTKIVADLDQRREIPRELCLALSVQQLAPMCCELGQVVEKAARPLQSIADELGRLFKGQGPVGLDDLPELRECGQLRPSLASAAIRRRRPADRSLLQSHH